MVTGIATSATNGALGFDTETPLTGENAANYRKDYTFCIRYVSFSQQNRIDHQNRSIPDLSAEEAQLILEAGLALMVVQHVDDPGWIPSCELGQAHGQCAAAFAQEAGIPAQVNVWLDLEGVEPGTCPDDVIAYCNAWYVEVHGAGYTPGLYVGANCGLDGDQLYYALNMQHYWRSLSEVPEITQRGYQLFQSAGPGSPIPIDLDTARQDNFQQSAIWLAPP